MGMFDFAGLVDAASLASELRKAFADLLAEQKKTNELLSDLIREVKKNGP